MTTKATFRKIMMTNLKTLSLSERQFEEKNLSHKFLSLIRERNYQTIGLYFGKFPEFQMQSLIEYLLSSGYEVCLPRAEKLRQLSFHAIKDLKDVETSSFGVEQPVVACPIIPDNKIDLLVVPGLAFRRDGYRIGFGGGYYDRYLAKNPLIPTISMVLSCQIIEEDQWQPDSYDIAVKEILSVEGDNKN